MAKRNESDADCRDLAFRRQSNGFTKFRHERHEINEAIGTGRQHDDCKSKSWDRLLERKVAINCNENVKVSFGKC